MKERPIIMTGESVRAIIDGRKTMTRRVMKVQPTSCGEGFLRPLLTSCPYGWKQERLWVRETWAQGVGHLFTFKADWGTKGFPSSESAKAVLWHSPMYMPRMASRLTLEITDVRVERVQDISEEDALSEGCTQLFMSQETINEIQITDLNPDIKKLAKVLSKGCFPAKVQFGMLWDEMNAKRGFSWIKNPWVWVISFRRVP